MVIIQNFVDYLIIQNATEYEKFVVAIQNVTECDRLLNARRLKIPNVTDYQRLHLQYRMRQNATDCRISYLIIQNATEYEKLWSLQNVTESSTL